MKGHWTVALKCSELVVSIKKQIRYFSYLTLVAQMVKHLPTMRETGVRSLGWEVPLKKEMAPHSSTLAWKIPWTKEPGRLQSMESQRVRHDWATSLSLFFQDISAKNQIFAGCIYAKLLQLCPTLCHAMDHSPLGSSDHGLLQARMLEWVAMPSSRGIFPTQGLNPCLLCLLHWVLYH